MADGSPGNKKQKKLDKLYFDPKHPGSLAGVQKFYENQKIATKREIEDFLSNKDAYTLHRPARRRFPRNRVVVGELFQMFDADLLFMTRYAEENQGYRYILAAVGILSHYAFCEKLRTKSTQEVSAAFRKILERAISEGRLMQQIRTDAGGEFTSKTFSNLLQSYQISHVIARNEETKANVVERLVLCFNF